MNKIALTIFVVLFAYACSKPAGPQEYVNKEIGLQFSYPGTWQTLEKNKLIKSMAAAKDKMTISEEALNEAREQAASIILTLYKPRMVSGVSQNPSINVLVIPVPEAQWKDIDMDTEIQSQLADIKVSLPGTEVKTNFLPLARYPEIHNYSAWIPTRDNTVTQHLYAYWRPPHFVQVTFGYTHPDDEQEVKGIIQSMQIEGPGK